MNKSDLKIVFMGTPAFAATCLEKLCGEGYNVVLSVSQPDKPVGRKHILTPPETKVYAQSQGIEVFQPTSMKSEEAYEKSRSCEPDLLITAAYGKILPQSVLDIPKYGCLNVHASLLPKYRGATPVQYSILNGDDVTGVTIMKMDAGMDTGDQITQVEVPIDSFLSILSPIGWTVSLRLFRRMSLLLLYLRLLRPIWVSSLGMRQRELSTIR